MTAPAASTAGIVLRACGAGLITLVTAALGFLLCFSDLSPSETGWWRSLTIFGAYAVGCTLVGILVPRAWALASIAALGPFLMGALGLVFKVARSTPTPYWSFVFVGLVLIPAASLGFGYAGSRVRKSRSRPA